MKTLLAASLFACFQPAFGNHAPEHAPIVVRVAETMSEGEVRRVDKEAKKLTIRHGPIANLDMSAMTMVFQVRDASLLDNLKPGDKIRFVAEKVDGAYVVSKVEPVR